MGILQKYVDSDISYCQCIKICVLYRADVAYEEELLSDLVATLKPSLVPKACRHSAVITLYAHNQTEQTSKDLLKTLSMPVSVLCQTEGESIIIVPIPHVKSHIYRSIILYQTSLYVLGYLVPISVNHTTDSRAKTLTSTRQKQHQVPISSK